MLSKLVDVLLYGFCFSFTFWQTLQAVNKFFDYPQSTSLVMLETSKALLPDVTICPVDDSYGGLNQTAQSNCELQNEIVSEKCPNATENYEALYNNPDDLLAAVTFMNGTCTPSFCPMVINTKIYPPNMPTIIHTHGGERCFTFTMPEMVKEKGLAKLMLSFKHNVYIKLHTPGLFFNEFKHLETDNDIIEVDINYEVIEQLNTFENPCIKDPTYRRDLCILKGIHQVIAVQKWLTMLFITFSCRNQWRYLAVPHFLDPSRIKFVPISQFLIKQADFIKMVSRRQMRNAYFPVQLSYQHMRSGKGLWDLLNP